MVGKSPDARFAPIVSDSVFTTSTLFVRSVNAGVIWLKQMAKLSLALVLLLCTFLGCNAKNEVQPIANSDAENTASVSAAPATKKLSERDGQLIRFLLNDSDNDPGDRIYFLTTTPMNKWTNDGGTPS